MTGADVKSARLRLGMTQENFAHKIGVTTSTVNRWENGHAKPSQLAENAIGLLFQVQNTSSVDEGNEPG